MDAERWERVSALLAESLAREAGPGAAWLEEACAGDADLHREVASLARAYRELGYRLGPVVALGEGSGRLVGPYRLLAELGRGGMSTVYLAERADPARGEPGRVAVKLIPLDGDSGERTGRFLRECQILARLEHPWIARLLESGITGEGQGYLALELVDGDPIDRYCERLGLPVAERCRLFLRVCAAVHHAHQNLVVHRDLKPGNVLVTAGGVPKLLDFGIAKLLAPESEGATTFLPALTPRYASPEQLRGETVTTGSDIYSLGVVLHQLLTGFLSDRSGESASHRVRRELPRRQAALSPGSSPAISTRCWRRRSIPRPRGATARPSNSPRTSAAISSAGRSRRGPAPGAPTSDAGSSATGRSPVSPPSCCWWSPARPSGRWSRPGGWRASGTRPREA